MIFKLSNERCMPPFSSSKPFLIDANILYFFHVGRTDYEPHRQNRIEVFSNYISELRRQGNTVAVSSFNLQEVLHAIERFEHEAYCSQYGDVHKKEYRKILAERINVKNKLEIAYKQINANYKLIDDVLSSSHIESFVLDYESHVYDPIDYFSISTRKSESFYYITDDSDFKSDSFLKNSTDIHLITY
jgi:hypothetical protein